jgi:hypothetical protein
MLRRKISLQKQHKIWLFKQPERIYTILLRRVIKPSRQHQQGRSPSTEGIQMTQLTEQFSAVRNTQLQAQLDVFRSLADRALDSTGQLLALNVRTSRQSAEQAARAFRELLDARDPRDLLAIGRAAQDQWQNLFSYGREMFGIAIGMPALKWIAAPSPGPAPAPAPAPTPALEVPATYAKGLEQAAAAAADAAAPEGMAPAAQASVQEAPASADAMAAVEAAIEAVTAGDMPPAAANPVASVMQEIAPLPASAEHPIAAPVSFDAGGELELPQVDPVDHAPPVHVTSGPATKATRGSRKK